MHLSYRGVAFDQNVSSVDMSDTGKMIQFRGAKAHILAPRQVPPHKAVHDLKYRGEIVH